VILIENKILKYIIVVIIITLYYIALQNGEFPMNPKRIEELRKILDLARNIYFAKKEISLLKPRFEKIFESSFDDAIQSLEDAIVSLKIIIGDLITENIFASWGR